MQVDARDLFRHVSAEKSALYRSIMDAFATAKRQFRLHLRPDEVLIEADWRGPPPKGEEVQQALAQLTEWGNLQSQPDTARVASISDFYRARFLYRLSEGGEAVESALAIFVQALRRRAELQSVALEDIAKQLQVLRHCVISSGYSKAWRTMPKHSWPASGEASSSSKATPALLSPTRKG
jgi:uncharacterized protein (TIGR02677 family)